MQCCMCICILHAVMMDGVMQLLNRRDIVLFQCSRGGGGRGLKVGDSEKKISTESKVVIYTTGEMRKLESFKPFKTAVAVEMVGGEGGAMHRVIILYRYLLHHISARAHNIRSSLDEARR